MNDFENLINDLRAATLADLWLAWLTGLYQGRLSARLAAESKPYAAGPDSRNFYLHDGYSTATVRHGSGLAVSLGGGQ